MVKSYLRYEPRAVHGLIASPGANVAFDASGKRALAPALESLAVWNLKQGTLESLLKADGVRAEVTAVAPSPDGQTVAVGYSDGRLRIWSLRTASCTLTLNGHR
jgi:U3 small nucleolar RNA-associated protein 12